ncbi:unnamed protein product [Larinioides sclopetarius]|uniref:Secreted protein n=1 Tax=Larinioides sclopetarius TaxID=280406 RepID=A0AAV2B221_9ARAC
MTIDQVLVNLIKLVALLIFQQSSAAANMKMLFAAQIASTVAQRQGVRPRESSLLSQNERGQQTGEFQRLGEETGCYG